MMRKIKEIYEVSIEVKGSLQPEKAKVEAFSDLAAISRFLRKLRENYGADNVYASSATVKKVSSTFIAEKVDDLVIEVVTMKSYNKDDRDVIASILDKIDESSDKVKIQSELLRYAYPVQVNFLDDSKSQILVRETRYKSTIKAIKLKEGFYLVTRLNIFPENRNKYCDEIMLIRLKEFAEENQIAVIITDVGKYGYSNWKKLRYTAINSGFQELDTKTGIFAAGCFFSISLTKTELKERIYEINKPFH